MILRNQGTKEPLYIALNFKSDLSEKSLNNDILLKPYDILFVPKTKISKVGDFVDQYINQLIPAAFSFGFIYNLNPELEVE